MTDTQAREALKKLTAFYNKSLEEYQINNWIKELKKIELDTCVEAINDIKTNPMFQNYLPTIPNFLQVCNKYKKNNTKVENREICWICLNKGFLIVTKIIESGKQKLPYDYVLHCQCGKGTSLKIDHVNKHGDHYYTEPVSKYFDINELIKENKKTCENKKITNDDIREKIKDYYKCKTIKDI